METNIIYCNDNLAQLRLMPDNSVDSIVTDSPYGLGTPPKDIAAVLLAWITVGYYEVKGKGFMGKQWDRFVPQPILWKEAYRVLKPGGYLLSFFGTRTYDWGAMAIRIAGFEIRDQIDWIYGSGFPKSKASLKPAHEPICVARKAGPLLNLNIDECRLGGAYFRTSDGVRKNGSFKTGLKSPTYVESHEGGRWPSNVIFDELTAEILDEQSGIRISGGGRVGEPGKRNYPRDRNALGVFKGHENGQLFTPAYADTGGASRFFYVAKASPSERADSKHPTIKPVKLMTQLVQLVTPVGGICLDMHCGTGPTLEACVITGRQYIGIDNDHQSVTDAHARLQKHSQQLFAA